MLEKEVSKEDLVGIKKHVHEAIAETTPIGVADRCLINKIIDEVYEENSGSYLTGKTFLARIRAELSNYGLNYPIKW